MTERPNTAIYKAMCVIDHGRAVQTVLCQSVADADLLARQRPDISRVVVFDPGRALATPHLEANHALAWS